MNQSTNDSAPSVNQVNNKTVSYIVAGSLLGLTWGSSLQAWMALLALQLGDTPKVTWVGTFGGILLSSTVVGALIGRSVFAAKSSEQKGWRWVLLSPVPLFVLLMAQLVIGISAPSRAR